MADQPVTFTVQSVKDETEQGRLISLNGGKVWSFVPGQVAVLGIPGVGESYFAIASAPEDKGAMEFLVKNAGGATGALFEVKKDAQVQAKGPVGKGFPIDQYKGRDMLIACVGSAIAPMRSVLRSIITRRRDFGKIVLVYGARYPEGFYFLNEVKNWQKSKIDVTTTVSRPEGKGWTGKTGHVQAHFAEALKRLSRPVAPICGMKAMMEESKAELVRLGIPANEILTNY